jgi:hypothetical protein
MPGATGHAVCAGLPVTGRRSSSSTAGSFQSGGAGAGDDLAEPSRGHAPTRAATRSEISSVGAVGATVK